MVIEEVIKFCFIVTCQLLCLPLSTTSILLIQALIYMLRFYCNGGIDSKGPDA